MGPSVVALGKWCMRDNSKDENELEPSKRPRSDSGRGESGGGVEERMVLCVPAPLRPPFSRVFSPLSGRMDKAASLCFQNARLEAANLMLQVEVERQDAQYCVALCCLVELQRERRATQDDLLHMRKVVGDMEDKLARLQVPEDMHALEDAEETHRCLFFASRWTLEQLATNLREDVPGLELAVQEQWQDM
ncbi:hypothetical protein C0992_004976, partial [Termitomyces sp. T32_za158]